MTSGALARAGLIVTAAFLLSRLLGWLRVVVLANLFGAGSELDAYYAAFRIPDMMFQLVAAGAIASALVPILSGLSAAGEHERAWRVASGVADLVVLALLVLAVAMAVLAPVLVPWLVPGFDEPTTASTVELTRIMLLSPIFLAAGSVASAVLNTEGRFGAAAMAPLLYNICIIGGALLLGPSLGVHGAALGVVVGSVAHLVIQVPALRRVARYRPVLEWHDPATRRSFLLMAPRAIGLGANQVTFLVNTALATGVGIGAVVAYNVAFSILQIPLGVIGLPIGVVLLPALSRAMATGDTGEFGRLVVGSLRMLLWMSLFVAVVGIVTRRESVALLFGWGFDQDALELTASTLGVFLLGLPAHSMNVILARAFYSRQDTTTPVAVAISSVVVNVVVAVATVETLGLAGLALGIALGGWFEALVLGSLLQRRQGSLRILDVVRGGIMSLLGALVAGAAAAAALLATGEVTHGMIAVRELPGAVQVLGRLALATAAAGVAYLLYSRAVRLPELPRTVALFRAAARRG